MDPQVELNMGCGHRAHHPPGHYAKLNKGVEANFTAIGSDEEVKNTPDEALVAEVSDLCASPLADCALGTSLGMELKMLDKALHSPHVKNWQKAYSYEIAQLKKHNLGDSQITTRKYYNSPLTCFQRETWH